LLAAHQVTLLPQWQVDEGDDVDFLRVDHSVILEVSDFVARREDDIAVAGLWSG
jgi:hypothetical protein